MVSALTLLLRFAAGAPVPLVLLQVAFILLLAAGALLGTRFLVGLVLRLQR